MCCCSGEGSPTVFWDLTGWDLMPQNQNVTPEAALVTPHCIHHLTPRAKIILVLRNPVDRLLLLLLLYYYYYYYYYYEEL